MLRRILPLCLGLGFAVVALPAAAAGGPPAGRAGVRVVPIATLPGQLAFDRTRVSARAGTVTLRLRNVAAAGLDHGIAISGHGVRRASTAVAPGRTARVTARLGRGTYTFFCPVPGHRAQGMRGTLTVR